MSDPIQALAQLRLERDLTFAELADQVGIDITTAYRLITKPGRRVHERTLYKVREYLRRVAPDSEAA